MTESNVINNINDVLKAGYRQSHYLIKDNIENKQIDEIEKLPETENCNNSVIRSYRKRHFYNTYLHQKSNISDRKVLFELQYKPV